MRSSDCQPWWSDRSGLRRKSPWSARVSYTTLRDMIFSESPLPRRSRTFTGPILKAAKGRFDPFTTTFGNVCYWRTPAIQYHTFDFGH